MSRAWLTNLILAGLVLALASGCELPFGREPAKRCVPEAEVCDGVDNDCDGQIDEGVLLTFYKDSDGDGYTDGTTEVACQAPSGYVESATSGDCDDEDAEVNPAKPEICDSKDNDCDGEVDGIEQSCYTGSEGTEGIGECKAGIQVCTDGQWSECEGQVLPQTETCDGKDNDCDGSVDEGVLLTFYKDSDGDGYTDGTTEVACQAPPGYVESATSGDCDDEDAEVNPAKPEICDSKDNDCDGQVDEGVKMTFYRDSDGDGYGDPNNMVLACSQPSGYVENSDDCDDEDAEVNPAKPEVCDSKDNNCDGQIDEGCGYLGDVIWLEGASPQNHSILLTNTTYDFSVTVNYSLKTTSSVILEFNLGAADEIFFDSTTEVISGSGTVTLNITDVSLPSNNLQIYGELVFYDLNQEYISSVRVVNYVSGSTSSVNYLFVKNENPQRGAEFSEGQTINIQADIEYNVSGSTTLWITAYVVQSGGRVLTDLVQDSVGISGSGVHSASLTFDVPNCYDFVFVRTYYYSPQLVYEDLIYPIRLTMPCLRVEPTYLSFDACVGEPPPPPEQVDIKSLDGSIPFDLAPSEAWMTLSKTSGVTPDTVDIGVDHSGLTEGSYSGSVSITSPDANNSSSVHVSLDVIPQAGPSNVSTYPGSSTIGISWNEVAGVDGYYVYRSITPGGPYTDISGFLDSGTTSYVDTNILTCTIYYYVVSATSACGEFYSYEVSEIASGSEICDGLDNDCNGQVDDGLTECYAAQYNADFGAPLCTSYVSPCSSAVLLIGRDNIEGGAERNAPNTIDGCQDGTSGTFHYDESLDVIAITSLDASGNYVAGGDVQVDFTVWCLGEDDSLDIYYASDVTVGAAPSWTYLSTFTCTSSQTLETFTYTFSLDSVPSSYHAIRGSFRRSGSVTSCSGGGYDEADDLVFPVE